MEGWPGAQETGWFVLKNTVVIIVIINIIILLFSLLVSPSIIYHISYKNNQCNSLTVLEVHLQHGTLQTREISCLVKYSISYSTVEWLGRSSLVAYKLISKPQGIFTQKKRDYVKPKGSKPDRSLPFEESSCALLSMFERYIFFLNYNCY